MNVAKQHAAAVLTDAAALVLLDTLIARMRHRVLAADQPGRAVRHPWLMAVAVEVAAQFGDALVYQRRRAAAVIDRAVVAQHLPSPASEVAGARGAPVPAPRVKADRQPLPHRHGLP
jgi:hypothetical protein